MDFQNILRNSRLKATPKRLAILDILADDPTYLSPEDIWKKLKKRFTNMGLPTVYRNLEYLSKENIVIKVIHPDRKLYYYYCHNTDHHHHFICLRPDFTIDTPGLLQMSHRLLISPNLD